MKPCGSLLWHKSQTGLSQTGLLGVQMITAQESRTCIVRVRLINTVCVQPFYPPYAITSCVRMLRTTSSQLAQALAPS